MASKTVKPLVTVVVPTYNAGPRFPQILKSVFSQSYQNFEVLVIDSTSTDETLSIAKSFGANTMLIPKDKFEHGSTRNLGVKNANGKFVVFMTQDAEPYNSEWLESLIKCLNNSNIAGAFSKQIPNLGANIIDRYNYEQDYPNNSRLIDAQNYKDSNVIYSNVSSGAKKEILLKYPFPENTILSEDLGWALEILRSNYCISYNADSIVSHSHEFNLMRLTKVVFDQGVAFSQIFESASFSYIMSNNKKRFVKKLTYLVNNGSIWWLLVSLYVDFLKYIFYTLGSNYQHIPRFIIVLLSNYPSYWKRCKHDI